MNPLNIKIELTPTELDIIFCALHNAQITVSYATIKALLDKMLEQGRPQLPQPEAHHQTP